MAQNISVLGRLEGFDVRKKMEEKWKISEKEVLRRKNVRTCMHARKAEADLNGWVIGCLDFLKKDMWIERRKIRGLMEPHPTRTFMGLYL
jgi:hypothetical protein